jgi:hypothetical protein
MSVRKVMLILMGLAFSAGSVFATTEVRRYALAVGSNYWGPERHTLRYAVSDAESFARVMETLGGVDSSDLIQLSQPSLIQLEDALEDLRHRIEDSPRSERTQVMVYFSGHANETGLLLGEEVFSYRSLRNWMDLVEADVRIAVLDACASGVITRLKGTRRRSPFLVDESSDMRGHAFLTSSSADEVAQESDRIGGSFFTHYLVSGLRGAADTSGEGKVTLNEAYQFAFHETLGRTTETKAGPQHPSYDINLSGTGEVVMTDVRQTSAILVLDDDLSGRFFVRDANERLVVELYKIRGGTVELGLEPGTYQVRCETESGASVSTAALEEGGQFVLARANFTTAQQEPVVVRGGERVHPRFGGMDGRWRLGGRLGSWYYGGLGSADSDFVWDTNNLTGGLVFSYWITEKWSADFTAWSAPMHLVQEENPTPDGAYIAAFLFGGRRYFPSLGGLPPAIKPFLAAAAGPYFRRALAQGGGVIQGFAAGGNVGGGFDFQLARWCMVGTKLGYNFTSDFTNDFTGTFGNKTNYSGWELSIDLSFLLGKGKTPN